MIFFITIPFFGFVNEAIKLLMAFIERFLTMLGKLCENGTCGILLDFVVRGIWRNENCQKRNWTEKVTWPY